MDGSTWHDRRPTHRKRPEWLVFAEKVERSALEEHDTAVDNYLCGTGTFDTMKDKADAALHAQAYALMCRDAYANGRVPALAEMPDDQINSIVKEAKER